MKTKIWKLALISFASLGFVSTISVLASCSSENITVESKSEIVKINDKFAEKKSSLQNKFGLPKYLANQAYDTTGKELIANAQSAVNELKQYKTNNPNIPIDEQIWLDSYIYNWETEINNWNNGLQYLGGNPSANALPLNTNSNHLNETISNAINIYKIDPDTLEPIINDNSIDVELAKNYINIPNELDSYINSLKNMLLKGMSFGVMPNNITKKLFVNQMLSNYYPNELIHWVTVPAASNGVNIQLPITTSEFVASDSLLNNFDAWSKWAKNNNISETEITNTKNSFIKAQKTLDDFINWYANDYYTNSNSFGFVGSAPTSLKITNTPITEERTIKITKDAKQYVIYGLGVSDPELELPKIGLGFMKSTLKINEKAITGNDIYQALLKFNNSVDKTAVQLVQDGQKLVAETTLNMKKVAEKVASLNNPDTQITNLNWAPSVMYDDNIEDDTVPTNIQIKIYENGTLNFTNFNKWLNQENFFFGRETNFWSQPYTGLNNSGSSLTNQEAYIKQGVNPEFDKYLNTLTTLGYAGSNGIWTSNKPIYGPNSVTGNQALAGAVLSLVDYYNFRDKTNEIFNYSFNSIPDYAIAPYNQKIQEIIGVGLEGPRGSNIFNYNVNPYFSLPKWSQSSFQNHEGKMGHHTQQAYWTKYMPDGENGPGYVFKQDAFHEGWAVFAEWYANELGVYGSNLDNTRMPTNWLDAKGFVPKISNVNSPTTQDINAIKNFQAGAYWDAASTATKYNNLTGDQAKALAATEIANLLQYYGYLNESQLRNMRLAVDPLYHYNDPNSNTTSGIVTDVNSTELPKYGASIKQIRTYLKNNSGLGQGDIQSESYRYLNMPSQATGYMTGKVIFESCFKKVESQYNTNNKDQKFLNNQKEVQKLFDLMLRNGEIPLQVLENSIKTIYKL